MFTGLVETMGVVERIEDRGGAARFVVNEPAIASSVSIGDSIAVNGCCLTVVEISGETFGFDAVPETLSRTNLGELASGSKINLETSLRVGDLLGGHYVTGHIDAVATVQKRLDEKEWSTFWFKVPKELTKQMASKGSVGVDGVSLTLVDVEEDVFSVALIPHTLRVTALGAYEVGSRVNIETDVLAKYVEQQMAAWPERTASL